MQTKTQRRTIYSHTPWEAQFAYSRAKRVGPHVYVAGTTAVDSQGRVQGVGDIYQQAKFIFAKIDHALQQCGANLNDVVRTRLFVTDMATFSTLAVAHQETFAGIDPVATCIEVSQLVHPDLLLEVEVDAIVAP